MKKISSQKFRKVWFDFWENKKHKYLPETSLIGGKESTAMFNIAGMQQLISYLNGKPHPLGKRLYNIQKCIRTVDIDEVGDESHLTFFEMMWNWSLGDYFKEWSIQYSREFLVDVLWFDFQKLAVTVFQWDKDSPKDEETAKYWKKLLPEERIVYMSAENNWRSPGPVWPCGPDTEIFYRIWKSELPPKKSNPKSDEENRLEIRNNVFMQYYRDENWKLTKLKNQNIDTGMWLERMCVILQEKQTIFETDIFLPIIEIIEKFVWKKYKWNEKKFRIVADHVRTAFFMIKNWIHPSNEWRWYVLRRIIRRMYFNVISLKEVTEKDFEKCLNNVVDCIKKLFNEKIDIDQIVNILFKECVQFQKTINNWQKLLRELFDKNKWKDISWNDIFKLYDTYGFPIELTREIAKEKWFKIDEKWFEKEMEGQKNKSRESSKFKQGIDRWKYLQWIPATKFTWYEKLDEDVKLLKDFKIGEQRILVFDKSPFYAESGGQTGDNWIVILDSWEKIEIADVKKYEWIFLHFVK